MKTCKKHGLLSFEDTYQEFSKERQKSYLRCKLCRYPKNKEWQKANLDKCREYNAKHREKNPEYRFHYIKKTHKISKEEYYAKIKSQNSLCAICNKPERRTNRKDKTPMSLCWDHNHVTGEHRGMLCNDCNRALGFFKDDIDVLKNAVKYLEKYNM